MMVLVTMVPRRWRRAVFRDVVSWCGSRSGTFAAAWSCHRCGAECETCEGENHEFFECLVHNAPSLSCFVVLRTPLPLTYSKEGYMEFPDKVFALFFDAVNHTRFKARQGRDIKDTRVLRLIVKVVEGRQFALRLGFASVNA